MAAIVRYTCIDHPRYTAKAKPRVKCQACWSIWYKVHEPLQPLDGMETKFGFNLGDGSKVRMEKLKD